jgi:hypothetical protein
MILGSTLAVVKHWISWPGTGTPAASGVPPLASGRFVAVLPLQVVGDQSQLGYLAEGIEEAVCETVSTKGRPSGVHRRGGQDRSEAATSEDCPQPWR